MLPREFRPSDEALGPVASTDVVGDDPLKPLVAHCGRRHGFAHVVLDQRGLRPERLPQIEVIVVADPRVIRLQLIIAGVEDLSGPGDPQALPSCVVRVVGRRLTSPAMNGPPRRAAQLQRECRRGVTADVVSGVRVRCSLIEDLYHGSRWQRSFLAAYFNPPVPIVVVVATLEAEL